MQLKYGAPFIESMNRAHEAGRHLAQQVRERLAAEACPRCARRQAQAR